ncbi:uncharacterized protein PgNI_04840 [Pyricularia grisea]|uniref:Pectate lyase superfamily protein domain-containing protein n=1 Tax=Pyricularia grisea TaxID=148305 RepID=A0A6P8BEG8_PYRGI|nr:uncharacterized protein PgNI_04840 [Pyricularia grisea]TLD14149.1 hypothetical protein PgNI_04840 [Pyricularia grisea]
MARANPRSRDGFDPGDDFSPVPGPHRQQQSSRPPQNHYFERPKPQYEQASAGDFVSTGASFRGDRVTDGTQCLQDAINGAAGRWIVFVDAGTYILTDTPTIPPGSRIVGENWAQLTTTGANFADETCVPPFSGSIPPPLVDEFEPPTASIKAVQAGQKGTADLQDLIFTSKGETAGGYSLSSGTWKPRGQARPAYRIATLGWAAQIAVDSHIECPPLRAGVASGEIFCNI